MKFFKFLLSLLLLGLVAYGAHSIFNGIEEGSEGTIDVETMEVEAVEVEKDTVPVVMEEVVIEEEKVEEVAAPAPVWEPASFVKLKDLDGRQVKLEGVYNVEKYGVKAKKGVIVNGDLYFVVKKQKYVIHAGQLIKL